MYSVSSSYNAAIYPEAGQAREVKGRVTFDISDVTAVSDLSSITSSAESSISDKAQTVNKVRSQKYNLATCEPDRFKLDGSFCFPDDTVSNNGKLGFCSSNLCGSDGAFASYPTLTFQFNGTHSSMGLTIAFDVPSGEYATDFNMAAYDSSGTLITSVDVTGNTLVQVSPVGQLYNYKKIVVTIKKWCIPNRRARVCEVDFGVVQTYEDDSLINFSYNESLDLIESPLTAPQFKFTVDNSDKRFNILNPTGIYRYLQQRQQVIAELGVVESKAVTEYIPLGNLLLYDWTSDDSALTATFTARTVLETMAGFNYANSVAKSNYTLYQLAVDIFTICGITNYQIDAALQSISTLGLSKSISCKNAIQLVCVAGCANLYVSRSGKGMIVSSISNIINPVDTLTLDHMYSAPTVSLDSIVQSVSVDYYTDINTSAKASITNANATKGGDTYSITGNTFINTLAQATAVGNWILQEKNYRAIYSLDWRGNPAHELNDVVSIENSFTANKNAIITKIDLTYEGYLKGTLEARGVNI